MPSENAIFAEEERYPGRFVVEPQFQHNALRGSSAEVDQECGFDLSVDLG